jgi:hypothetical protein
MVADGAGSSPSSPDPAVTIATRLGLRPAKDRWNEPWRYWLLRYVAALAADADYEGTHFGRDEARVAVEQLRDAAIDVCTLLSKERKPRR